MVFPVLIPVVAGIAGGFGGFGLGEILGSKKAAVSSTYAPVTTTTDVYAPSVQYAPQMSYGYQGGDIIISSPYAETKKEALSEQASTPTLTPSYQISPAVTSSPAAGVTKGTNIIYLVGIAAVALVAYGWVSRK